MKKTLTVILKIIATVLLISMLLFLVAWFSVVDMFHMGKFRLSLLNEELCKEFVLDQGVTIPEEFSDFTFQPFFVSIEGDPHQEFIYGWTALADFCYAVRDAVNAYYGIEPLVR